MDILDKIRKHKWFLIGVVILSWVIFVNLFPDGRIIAGEDTFQFINLKHSFRDNFYEWQGRASLFYGVFYLLDKVGVSETSQLSWYLGLFIFISYSSFYIFSKIVFKKPSEFIAVFVSLFYALNLYTLYVFTYSWGYSYYQILYAFIPLIVGLYIAFLRSQKLIYGALFCLSLLLASSGFGNPAFAIALLVFLLALTVALSLIGGVKMEKSLFKKLGIVFSFSILINGYWILPILSQAKSGVASLSGGNILDLKWWIQHTSNSIINILRLEQFNNKYFFPLNFPYERFVFLKDLFSLLTLLPVVIILISLWQKKKKEYQKMYWSFFAVLVFFVMLISKVRFPFEKINNFLFQLPGLNTLRGYEKLAIFTPFILAVLLLVFFLQSKGKRHYKIVVVAFLIILMTPAPFFAGKIQQDTSFILANKKHKDYQGAKYSFLVDIPDEYYEIQSLINDDKEDVKIASLPYNVIGSIGWVNYPKWQLQGADVTHLLYDKKAISPNGFYFNQWLFAKDFNELPVDPEWMAELLGVFNVKYIIYHKDVSKRFLDQSLEKIEYLERVRAISKVRSNEYFDLYELNSKYRLPQVFAHKENISLGNGPLGIMKNFDEVKEIHSSLNYREVNPKKFVIDFEASDGMGYVSLNEPYDSNWRAYFVSDNSKERLKGVKSLGYANGWKLKEDMRNGEIVIEYFPMKVFYWGAYLSLFGFVVICVYVILYLYGKRKR
ncbi:hypothetical protein ACFL08_01465 [Patescibacteria group bacterium]